MSERLKRAAGYALAAVFAVVGLVFLLIPGLMLSFFNDLSAIIKLPPAPLPPDPFFVVLATAYMVVVTALAWGSATRLEVRVYARLLVLAKAASSILSFGYFALAARFLVLLVNGVVDGLIALFVYRVFVRGAKDEKAAYAVRENGGQ